MRDIRKLLKNLINLGYAAVSEKTLKPTLDGVLLGPIAQILPMDFADAGGAIPDEKLPVLEDQWIRFANGVITAIGPLEKIRQARDQKHELRTPHVCLPGLIDAHTHLCYAGKRSADYASRLSGMTYGEIASLGGGILDTVRKTRQCPVKELTKLLVERIKIALTQGVTTCEVKTGYGLNYEDEMKMLEAIRSAKKEVAVSLIPTCLAAHTRPTEYRDNKEYLSYIIHRILKTVVDGDFCNRVDIFVDEHAFSVKDARHYLTTAKNMGFKLVVHADQFSVGGSTLAAELGALSADHLEASGPKEFEALKKGNVIPIVLPGACLGLGMPFPDCRGMLDANLPLVIATDWNPGSAPLGNLLLQASLLGMSCKLTTAETLAAITSRAAKALDLDDRGVLKPGNRADFILFHTDDYRDILYNQGNLLPSMVFIQGCRVG